jgi:hypothetical protein
MKLIHRYDNKNKVWISELFNNEGALICKEEYSGEVKYELGQKVTLGENEHTITHFDYSMYSATRLIAQLK